MSNDSRTHLSAHYNFLTRFIANRTAKWIGIIEYDGDCRFCDSSLTLFVNELLKVPNANLRQDRDTYVATHVYSKTCIYTYTCTKYEADGVEDVALSRSIESSDGIEMGIKT